MCRSVQPRDSAHAAATFCVAAAAAWPFVLPAASACAFTQLLHSQALPPCAKLQPRAARADIYMFLRALTGCPDNKMKDAIEGLSPPQQSLLMQYIYRGLAQRNEVIGAA